MMSPSIKLLVLGLIHLGLVLLLAPLFEGIIRKITALVQSRKGPPLFQPYYDVMKLLVKDDIESGVAPVMQRFAAYLSLASVLMVGLLVPMGGMVPFQTAGDVILLIYLLTLSGIATLLAGLAGGSTYSLVGMSREMMSMMTLEPLLAVSIIIGSIHAGSLRLDTALQGAVFGTVPISGILICGVILFGLQAFVGRVPFDVTEAETEIMEGPLIEYTGPKLALFKMARMGRLFIYCALFIAIFVPWGQVGYYPLDLLIFLGKVLFLVLFVTLIAATHARYRIDQVVRYYMILFVVALLALVLAVLGY